MAHRLIAALDGFRRRIPLARGENVVGSRPGCDVHLDDRTVSRRHAVLIDLGDRLVVRDLNSRNGTWVDGQRVSEAEIAPGAPLQFGAVAAEVERVEDADLEAGLHLGETGDTGPALVPGPGASFSTSGFGPGEAFALDHLPRLVQRLGDGISSAGAAQLVGSSLFQVLPCFDLVVETVDQPSAVVFRDERPERPSDSADTVTAAGGGYTIAATVPKGAVASAIQPLVEAGCRLIELADVRRGSDPVARPTPPAPHPPDPPSVTPTVRQLYEDAARVARGQVSVLILGESGTGKDLLARYIHAASPRRERDFLSLNCASLPQDLLESELFGIEKGVATGVDARPGRFEQADGGTLFLDEIGDMAPGTQAKILRVLQSGETYRVGARQPRQVDVRVIAATNRDLRRMMAEGDFREDLYHRIAMWVAEIPPLRRRRADIPNLAAFFLDRAARAQGVRVRGISRAALDCLAGCPWPGNVRQLENEMARAVLFLEDGELLDTPRLSDAVGNGGAGVSGGRLADTLERVERDEIVLALERSSGDVAAAAEALGISRATLYRRIKALGVTP
jgi:DNA-binding NtrC family response regulator